MLGIRNWTRSNAFQLLFFWNCSIDSSTNNQITLNADKQITWDELLAPAPMGIAVMSQLLICASRVIDFEIDKTDKVNIPLLKHPKSFRTTLVQISNESYNAFMLAHNNMERIHLKMEEVPRYVTDCVKFMNSGNKTAINKLLPQRLERIKEAANGGLVLSKEVCQAFAQLRELIQQTLLAATASMGDKEKAFKAKMDDEKKRQEEAKERKEKKLQEEIEYAQQKERKNQEHYDESRKRKWDLFLTSFFAYESKSKSVEYARQMKEEAEEQLKQTKQEAEDRQKEIDQIFKENMEKLEKMGSDINSAISQDQTIAILQEGLQHLGKLQEQWNGITSYFDQIWNNLNEKTIKRLEDLVINVDAAKEEAYVLKEILPESAQFALESSHKTHHSAKMYVTVSNKYIIKSINQMHGMLALPSSEVANAQKQLMASCKEASEGVRFLYKEEMEHTRHEMEMKLSHMSIM